MSFERPPRPEKPSLWKRPDLTVEKGELLRTARTLAPEREEKLFAREIYESLSKSALEELTDEDWSRLENTDSWEIVPGDFETVAKLAENYSRDWEKFKRAFESGTPVSAPTIVKYKDRLHKVGGNTRLMVAKAMGIRPMVVMAEIKEDSK